MIERHRLPHAGGVLALALHLPATGGRAPCVVACHGLRTSKDGDKYLLLGDALAAAGLALARFDFRGCGESSGAEEDTTVGSRVEDVQAVLAFLAHHRRLDGRVGLLGSSLGGFVALHVAAGRPEAPPVVTWNAPASLVDLGEREGDPGEGLGIPFFEELATHRYAESPAGVSRHLVVHGEADDVVPLEHAMVLHARAAEPCDVVVVAGADHRLSDPGHRQEALAHSLAWLARFLA
jgi:dipeptidyl aminopeptidase/acylaminoacyl peptidase